MDSSRCKGRRWFAGQGLAAGGERARFPAILGLQRDGHLSAEVFRGGVVVAHFRLRL
jgi:hypothetical protein